MFFVVENCGNLHELLAQLVDIGRIPDSRRPRFRLNLRQDNVEKSKAPRQTAFVLITGVNHLDGDNWFVRGKFTRQFQGTIGTNWWSELPFTAILNMQRRKGKLELEYQYRVLMGAVPLRSDVWYVAEAVGAQYFTRGDLDGEVAGGFFRPHRDDYYKHTYRFQEKKVDGSWVDIIV